MDHFTNGRLEELYRFICDLALNKAELILSQVILSMFKFWESLLVISCQQLVNQILGFNFLQRF